MIPSLDAVNVDLLREKMIHKAKIHKRFKNTPKLEDFILGYPVLLSSDGLYIGGLFGAPSGSFFLTEILTDKDFDISEPDVCISFLSSTSGEKIQKARFRDDILKPVKKILKNRDISDINFAKRLVLAKFLNELDGLLEYLDSIKSYTAFDISRYFAINATSS